MTGKCLVWGFWGTHKIIITTNNQAVLLRHTYLPFFYPNPISVWVNALANCSDHIKKHTVVITSLRMGIKLFGNMFIARKLRYNDTLIDYICYVQRIKNLCTIHSFLIR